MHRTPQGTSCEIHGDACPISRKLWECARVPASLFPASTPHDCSTSLGDRLLSGGQFRKFFGSVTGALQAEIFAHVRGWFAVHHRHRADGFVFLAEIFALQHQLLTV